MGGHRGAAALAKVAPVAIREISIGLGLAVVGALAWHRVAVANRTEWEAANAKYDAGKAAKRKQFEQWLAAAWWIKWHV